MSDTDPVTSAMNALYANHGDGVSYPASEREALSHFLSGEFRAKLLAAERAIADELPPEPWSGLGEALAQDGYVRTKRGLRRLGERP